MEGMISTEGGARKDVAYYELNLGLNHVSRRWATPTNPSACSCLAPLHGELEGPSGELVGGEDWIDYLHKGCCLVGGGKMLEFVEENMVQGKMKEYVLKRKYLCPLDLILSEKKTNGIIAGWRQEKRRICA